MSFNKTIIISLLIRLLLIPYFADAFNYWSSCSFANFAIAGYNPWVIMHNDPRYLELSLFGYPPPFLLVTILASLSYTSTKDIVPFLYALKLPLVLADILTLFLVCKIAKHMTNDENYVGLIALLYALNPMPLIVSTVWGTNDVLAIVFTVAAMYCFLKGNYPLSGFLLGIGCSFKIYPAYLILAFIVKLRKREIAQFILAFSLPVLIFILPFLAWDANAYLSGSSAFRTKYLLSITSIFTYAFGDQISSLLTSFSYIPIPLVTNLILGFVVWKKKPSLLASILMSLLVVYVTSPYMWGNYFSWIVPFAVLANVDNAIKRMRKSVLTLQLYWVPSFIYMLFVNGWYDDVGGSAGIFYWTHHWLQWRIVPWRYIGPNISLLYIFVVIVNFVIGLLLLKIMLTASRKVEACNIRGNIESECHSSIQVIITKHVFLRKKSAILIVLLTTLLLLQSFYMPVLSSKWEHIPNPALSPNIIFDDYDSSLLNPQWKFFSNSGVYDIYSSDKESFIQLRTSAGPLVAYLLREVTPSQGTVEFRFKFEQLSSDSEKMILSRVEGGYLGVTAYYNSGTVFFYQDEYAIAEETEKIFVLSSLDNSWHTFKIEYVHDCRYVYFENELRYVINDSHPVAFSYVLLGTPNYTGGIRGVLSFDWIKINMTDFPTGKRDTVRVFLSILVPWITTALVLAAVALKENVSFWIKKCARTLTGEELNET